MIKRWRPRSDFTYLAQLRLAWIILVLLMLAYAILVSDQAVLRYTTFKADAFDLGNMDQAIWNTIHGRPFQFTNQGSDNYGPPTRLATHVEPILLLLSLLYAFHADPRILLIFQTIALAAGALPVFLLMRRQLPPFPLLAPVMAAAYLASPSLLGMNLYDFHPVSLATPLLLYAVLALDCRRYGWFVVACILACACKEDMPLAVAMLGILVIWKYALPRLGIALFIGGILWSACAFFIVMPHFFPGAQHNNYWYRYAALGSTPSAAVVNVLLHPWLLFAVFLTLDRVYYLINLLRSTGFLALLAPEWLLPTLPSLAINLLASGAAYHSGVYHYNAAIIPFISIAAIYGTRRLLLRWYHWRDEAIDGMINETSLDQKASRRGARIPVLVAIYTVGCRIMRNTIASVAYIVHSSIKHPLVTRLRTYLSVLRKWSIRQGQRGNSQLLDLARRASVPRFQRYVALWIIAMFALNFAVMMPFLDYFWPGQLFTGYREQQIQQVLDLIPPDASVSAGGNLNPHLTDRRYITVFPQLTYETSSSGVDRTVEYVVVDLDAVSPEDTSRSANFLMVLNQLRRSRQFRQIAEADGVILLMRDNT